MWKSVGVVLMFITSTIGGAILGAIVGGIYGPVKIYEWMTGKGESDETTYIDDEI